MIENDEIVQAFLEESAESLDLAERLLVDLEARPNDPDLLAQLYRAIHTIKGTCGFLGFGRLETLTHCGEDLLDALRSGRLVFDTGITSSLLELVDAVRATLARVETTGGEGEAANETVIAALVAQLGNASQSETASDSESNTVLVLENEDVINAPPPTQAATPVESGSSVRVDVAVLDNLTDLVGELVLTRSQIGEVVVAAGDEGPLVLPYRQLMLQTTELQENVMRARLQPIGSVIGKFPRLARDLAASMGKQVRVELSGEDVGVDRAVNEAMKDALTHLVRNSVDHGIELPDERTAAGKDPEGCLRIRASHGGGRIHIELSDDGGGVDPQRLIENAVIAGKLTQDEANALSTNDALNLMFLPGLSTKQAITTVSGRGVGMDAVRASLDQLGASIEISSEAGRGTVFRISVPLTLTIVDTVVVHAGGERYIFPQMHVQEVLNLERDEVRDAVEDVVGTRLLRLRGQLIPLVELAGQLGINTTDMRAVGMVIIVVEIDGRRFGVVVDRVDDTVEAVVKPLTRATRAIPVFAGVTILSDGAPTLIVDLDGLANVAGLISKRDDGSLVREDFEQEDDLSLLLAKAGGQPFAVHVSSIWRLEQFPETRIERSGPIDVCQYRDTILPLIKVADLLGDQIAQIPDAPTDNSGDIRAIVCHSSAGPVGLIVDSIEDVVPEPSTPVQPSNRRGVSSRLVIDDRVTELIDIEMLVADTGVGQSR